MGIGQISPISRIFPIRKNEHDDEGVLLAIHPAMPPALPVTYLLWYTLPSRAGAASSLLRTPEGTSSCWGSSRMQSNLRLVLLVSALFGIATGIYEFILPIYLKAQGVSFTTMGAIFALAGLAMVLARIYMGGLADRWGRKPLYGWALAVCGGVTMLTALPQAMGLGWQLLLKTLRETAALTRETIHPIVLYEERHGGFLNRIGKFRGVEFLLQAGGTLLAGLLIKHMASPVAAYRDLLLIAGMLMLFGAAWWLVQFRERRQPGAQRIVSLREMLDFNIHPNLRLVAISGILFTFGVQLSHSFYLPLFFGERFHASPPVVALIMVLHRITIALPLLIVGNLWLRNLRAWYIAGIIIEGVTMAASAVAPGLLLSASIFMLHDLIGAGIWSPIQATIIQQFSRDETRGLEVGKVLAWSSIGAILGPLAAGPLAEYSTMLPFFASGIVMILSALPLYRLNLSAPAPSTPTEASVA